MIAAALLSSSLLSLAFAASTCPNAVPSLRRLRDDFDARESIREFNRRSGLMRKALMFRKEKIGPDSWTLAGYRTPEKVVCATKQRAMELLIAELEQRNMSADARLKLSSTCFTKAAGISMMTLYGFKDKKFQSQDQSGIFVLMFISILTNVGDELSLMNTTFRKAGVIDSFFSVSEHVGDVFSNRHTGSPNLTAVDLEAKQIAFEVLLELRWNLEFLPMASGIDTFSAVNHGASLLTGALVLPVFASFYHKHRQVYELLYLILLCSLDVAITLFFLLFGNVVVRFLPDDSGWQCLSLMASADPRIGMDVRIVASLTLQAVLSIEKFIQIRRISMVKDAVPRPDKGYWRITRCIITFCATICVVMGLQGVAIQHYSARKPNYVVRFLRNALREIYQGIPPNHCDNEDSNQVFNHDIFSWFLCGIALASCSIAGVLNIITAVLLKRTSTSDSQKASSVYFLQIVLCTGLLSVFAIGAIILVIVNAFVDSQPAMYVSVCLSNIVGIIRNSIYIGTSKKLRNHVKQMLLCVKRKA